MIENALLVRVSKNQRLYVCFFFNFGNALRGKRDGEREGSDLFSPSYLDVGCEEEL